jgi:uncharacterized protein YdgA (DUF945 family)
MKKIVIGILLLLVIAGIGVPFVNGLVMEKIVKKSFANLNSMYANTGSGVSIEIMRYNRGVSSTEIEWKIKLGAMQGIYGVAEIIFVDRADHGYTGIVSTTSLEKNKWYTDFVSHKLAGKNPLVISTEYKLSGQINSTITLAAFSLPVEGEVVAIKPGKALFTWDEELKNFSSDTSWQGFSAADKMTVDGISISSNLEKISTYLWDGTLSYGVAKVDIKGNNAQFELAGIKGDYSLDIDKEENTVSVVATFGADRLQAGLEKVENGFVRLGVINMDAQGFEEFVKLYTEMANTVLKDFTAAGDDPEKMKTILEEQVRRTQLQMLTAYERLLKKGLEFQISDLHAQLPEGEIHGDVAVSLNKDMTFAQFIPLLNQPELILDVFSLQSDISLPATLVNDNPRFLSPIYPGMQTGLFVKNGNLLSHKAETRDAKLYLNGQEFQFH